MSKRTAWALLILSAAAVVLLFVFARERAERARRAGRGPVVRPRSAAPLHLPPTPLPPPPAEKTRVTLFFVAKEDGLLRPEERDVEKPTDAVGFAREILREEIAGPKDPALAPALPPGLSLRNAFVPGGGRVIADVNVDAAWARAAGSAEELACVGAIVNSLLQNLAQTDRVQILVNGGPVETLAGHVDLTRPIPAMKDVMGGALAAPSPGAVEAPGNTGEVSGAGAAPAGNPGTAPSGAKPAARTTPAAAPPSTPPTPAAPPPPPRRP
ncbi:MAG TPA: GerMN domain-containing protein [Thermoanaerobaculia bacterium]|nr:GerMN domain-containing protein [Thermoanaerobaculia bacterium]